MRLFSTVLLVIGVSSNTWAYQGLTAEQSQCLESVSNEAILRLPGDIHLIRNEKDQVAEMVDIMSGYRWYLSSIGQLDVESELVTFANESSILNMFGKIQSDGVCVLKKIDVFRRINRDH